MNEGRDMRKKSQQFTYLVWSFLLMFFFFLPLKENKRALLESISVFVFSQKVLDLFSLGFMCV